MRGKVCERCAHENARRAIGKLDGPNPSGLNAHYQQPALSNEYARLAAAVG